MIWILFLDIDIIGKLISAMLRNVVYSSENTRIGWLMAFRQRIPVYSEKNTK
jgi:hypothetical protein